MITRSPLHIRDVLTPVSRSHLAALRSKGDVVAIHLAALPFTFARPRFIHGRATTDVGAADALIN
jgi:hypothetical protein